MYYTIVSENSELNSHTCLPSNGKLYVSLDNVDENGFQEAIISAGVPEVEIPLVREYVSRNKAIRRSIITGSKVDVRREIMNMFRKDIIEYISKYITVKDPHKQASCIINGTLVTYQPDSVYKDVKNKQDTTNVSAPVSINVTTTKRPRKPIHKKPTFVIALITTIINAIVSSGILSQIHTNNSTLATILSIIVTVVSALEHYNENDEL